MTTATPTSNTETIDLPEATVILDHGHPVDFEREAAPLLGLLLVDYIKAQALVSRATDSHLLHLACGATEFSDIANAAGALFAARNGGLDVWTDEDVAAAAVTLREFAPAAA